MKFSDGRLNLEVIQALEKAYPGKIRLMSQTEPIVRFTAKEEIRNIIAFVGEMLDVIPDES